MPRSKLSFVVEAMQDGNWPEALRLASKFPQLGAEAKPITRAWSALQNPELYRQMGKDPGELLEDGKAALLRRYGHCLK